MRTPKPSRAGASRDLTLLVRALVRAERDESRPPASREALCAHLRGAINILSAEPKEAPRRKRGPAVGASSSSPAEAT